MEYERVSLSEGERQRFVVQYAGNVELPRFEQIESVMSGPV